MFNRRKTLVIGLALAVALVGGIALHARARRAQSAEARRVRVAAARVLGMPDLALSSTSRWLRHPSQSEPGAAFADAPATLDADPAAAAIGPPRALLEGAP